MKKQFNLVLASLLSTSLCAQATLYPAPAGVSPLQNTRSLIIK